MKFSKTAAPGFRKLIEIAARIPGARQYSTTTRRGRCHGSYGYGRSTVPTSRSARNATARACIATLPGPLISRGPRCSRWDAAAAEVRRSSCRSWAPLRSSDWITRRGTSRLCRALHPPPRAARSSSATPSACRFPKSPVDAVLNIESSHCYASIDAFLAEVNRVLRPNGRFLFADYRDRDTGRRSRRGHRSGQGFTVVRKLDITENIVRSLREDSERRVRMIGTGAPAFLHGLVREFAGVDDSCIFDDFLAGQRRYLSWVLRTGP